MKNEITNVFDLIAFEEGFRMKPYHCSEGYPTIGIGKRIGPKGADLSLYEFTVNKAIAVAWLKEEVEKVNKELIKHNWFRTLTMERRWIITSMAYQLGITGLFKFKNMITALEEKRWGAASGEALDSTWHKQTKLRAERHAKVLYCGSIKDVY